MESSARRESLRQGTALDEVRRQVEHQQTRLEVTVVGRWRAARDVERRKEQLQEWIEWVTQDAAVQGSPSKSRASCPRRRRLTATAAMSALQASLFLCLLPSPTPAWRRLPVPSSVVHIPRAPAQRRAPPCLHSLAPDAPQLDQEPPAAVVESLAELDPEPEAAPAIEISPTEKGEQGRIERAEEDAHRDGGGGVGSNAGGSIDMTEGQNGLHMMLNE